MIWILASLLALATLAVLALSWRLHKLRSRPAAGTQNASAVVVTHPAAAEAPPSTSAPPPEPVLPRPAPVASAEPIAPCPEPGPWRRDKAPVQEPPPAPERTRHPGAPASPPPHERYLRIGHLGMFYAVERLGAVTVSMCDGRVMCRGRWRGDRIDWERGARGHLSHDVEAELLARLQAA